jgi:hypothetical protein
MSQRSAHFSRPDGPPEGGLPGGGLPCDHGEGAEPTFAISIMGFGGVPVVRGGHPAQ